MLIEDKASGTQLIQELIADGCHGVTRYQPTIDKTMRLHAQTAMIENGFVYIPETAPWLAEYLHEMTVFPKGKHDDQVDSTAQFLDWFKKPFPSQGIFEYYRQLAEARAAPQTAHPKSVLAPGCMEWLAEQEKARSTAAPDPVPLPRRTSSDTARQPSSPWRGSDSSNPPLSSAESATNLVAAGGASHAVGPRVRIRFAPAASLSQQ